MYLFEAKYYNRETDNKRTQGIEISECPFENEEQIFIHAMKVAYELKNDFEWLDSLEFIAC